MPAKKQLTIKQVAHKAGVSTQTVSRVLNDRPDVAPETRQRVQDIINQLGYQPNAIARSLIRRRSHTLGIIASELEQYGPVRTLAGIEHEANRLGYSPRLRLVDHPETDNGEQLLKDLLAWQVDGIIWAVPEVGDNRAWLQDKKSRLSIPMIFLDGQPGNHFTAVSADNRAGGRLVTEHLLAQGYQHIGLITGPLSWHAARQRQLGWQDTLSKIKNNQTFEGDWSAVSGERGLRQLLEQFPEMDAVFACNDQMALGVLQAAHQLGLRVPEDLAVVGYDNIPESAYFWPPLTTVQQQLIKQGETVVQELCRIIEAEQQAEAIVQPETTLLEPQLVVRKSSVAS